MKLNPTIQAILLYPSLNANFSLGGESRHFPANLKGRFLIREKTVSLVAFKRAGFAWINNSDIS